MFTRRVYRRIYLIAFHAFTDVSQDDNGIAGIFAKVYAVAACGSGMFLTLRKHHLPAFLRHNTD